MSMNIQINEKSLDVIREISQQKGLTVSEVLDEAVEAYRRGLLLDETSAAFQALKKDPEAWLDELEERELWENTLADGVESP
jgi:hypothetical protein